MAAVNLMVAGSTARARDLLLPEAWATAHARTRGDFPPLEPVTTVTRQALTPRQQGIVEDYLPGSVFGTPQEVADQLDRLLVVSGADELLAAGLTPDQAAQAESDRLLAEAVRPSLVTKGC